MKLSQNFVRDGNRATISMQRCIPAGGARPMQFEGAADSPCRGGFETRPWSDFPRSGRFESCPYTASCYDFGRLGDSETVSDACPTNSGAPSESSSVSGVTPGNR